MVIHLLAVSIIKKLGATLAGATAVIVTLVVLVVVIELLRRWRVRSGGWVDYVRSGASVDVGLLVDAIEGRIDREEDVMIRRHILGKIEVPTGRLAACDARLEEETAPFDIEFPRGRFEVRALIVERDGDQRCAALWVAFRDEPITRMEIAFAAGERERAERRCELPMIGVDSATIALGSPEALAAVTEGEDIDPGPSGATNPYRSGRAQDLCRLVERGPGLVTALSGLGDGGYPALIARGVGGSVVALVLDLGLVGTFDEVRVAA